MCACSCANPTRTKSLENRFSAVYLHPCISISYCVLRYLPKLETVFSKTEARLSPKKKEAKMPGVLNKIVKLEQFRDTKYIAKVFSWIFQATGSVLTKSRNVHWVGDRSPYRCAFSRSKRNRTTQWESSKDALWLNAVVRNCMCNDRARLNSLLTRQMLVSKRNA